MEIIKSMVYGGLIEAIASLGIVSSAAGADAATCKCFGFFLSAADYQKNLTSQYCEIISLTFSDSLL